MPASCSVLRCLGFSLVLVITCALKHPWPPHNEAITNLCQGPPFVQLRLLLDISSVREASMANTTAVTISHFLKAADSISPLSKRPMQMLIANGKATWVLPFEVPIDAPAILNFLNLWAQMLRLKGRAPGKGINEALQFARLWRYNGVPQVLVIFAEEASTASLWSGMGPVQRTTDRILVLKPDTNASTVRIELDEKHSHTSPMPNLYHHIKRLICTLESCPSEAKTTTSPIVSSTLATTLTAISPLNFTGTTPSVVNNTTHSPSTSNKPEASTESAGLSTEASEGSTITENTPSAEITSANAGTPSKVTDESTTDSGEISTGAAATSESGATSTKEANAKSTESEDTITDAPLTTAVKDSSTSSSETSVSVQIVSTEAPEISSRESHMSTEAVTTEAPEISSRESHMSTEAATTEALEILLNSSEKPSTQSDVSTESAQATTEAPEILLNSSEEPSTQSDEFTESATDTSANSQVSNLETTESSVLTTQAPSDVATDEDTSTAKMSTSMASTIATAAVSTRSPRSTSNDSTTRTSTVSQASNVTRVSFTPLPTTTSQCTSFKTTITQLLKVVNKTSASLVSVEEEKKSLESDLTACREMRSNLTDVLYNASQKFSAQYRAIKNRTMALEKALADCKEKVIQFASAHNASLARLLQMQARITELDSDLKIQVKAAHQLRIELEQAKALVAVLKEKLQVVDANRQRLEAELALEKARYLAGQLGHAQRLQELERKLAVLEKERDNLVRQLAQANEEKKEIETRVSQLLKDVEARASFLLFSLSARTGRTFASTYYGERDYSLVGAPQRGPLYKSPSLKLWTVGRYRRVSLILRKNGRPVVRMDFDGQQVGRYNWFNKRNLLESFPWPAESLRKQTSFLMGSVTAAAHFAIMRQNSTCMRPEGFLAIIDSTASCYWTWTHQLGRYPHFLYSLRPTGLPGLLSSFKERQEADTLEIRVNPYVTFHYPTGSVGNFGRWDMEHQYLVFSITTGSNLNPAAMWSGHLQSPPEFLSGHRLLASNWFRSAALATWPAGRFRRAVISLVDVVGVVRASFEFDLVGASRDNWFSLKRLRSAWPWTAREIRENDPQVFRIGKKDDSAQFVIGANKGSKFNCNSSGFLAVLTDLNDFPCVRGPLPMLVANLKNTPGNRPLLHAPIHLHQLRISML